MRQFSYPKNVFSAYKSAEVHTKAKFRLPLIAYLPLVLVPLAVWAVPATYHTFSGISSGKGLQGESSKKLVAAPGSVAGPVTLVAGLGGAAVEPVPVSPIGGVVPAAVPAPEVSGCIVMNHQCGCFDGRGKRVTVEPQACADSTGQGLGKPLEFPASLVSPAAVAYARAKRDKAINF